ncbi:MAG: hypothetical protein GX046_08120 [Tissierellia bacterium]|jgi:hypothetical protein|nr:hypothetical protein [Tissierellia bacterium]
MKKFVSIILIVVLITSLTACGGNKEQNVNGANSTSVEEDSTTVKVDEGLLQTKVTLPATFFKETSEDQIKAGAEEAGYKSYKINPDGSVTYTMSKSKHKEILDEFSIGIQESIDDLLNENKETKVESFSDIKYNDDYSEFNIYIDSETHNVFNNLYALAFYIQGAYYQIFKGISPEDVNVVVNFIDNVSGDVMDSGSYRDWIDNLNENNPADNSREVPLDETQTLIKNLELNETVEIGELMEITLTNSEWVESIIPSNTSGFYTYYEDEEGEKFFVIHGILKNIGSKDINIQWMNKSEITINEKYNFSANMELESNDGTDFYASAKPLQTLNLIIYASISDEAYEIYESIDVNMKILSEEENINSFYDDNYKHETLKIRFVK